MGLRKKKEDLEERLKMLNRDVRNHEKDIKTYRFVMMGYLDRLESAAKRKDTHSAALNALALAEAAEDMVKSKKRAKAAKMARKGVLDDLRKTDKLIKAKRCNMYAGGYFSTED